jgi:hypothetical protein
MKRIALLISVVCLLANASSAEEGGYSAPSEEKLAKSLGGPEVLAAMRAPGRIEAVRIRDKEEKGARVPGQFVETGPRFDLPPEQAAAVRALLGDRHTYLDGSSACIFAPGIKFILHPQGQLPIEWLVCLHCGDLAVERDGREVGFASYLNGHEKVIALARQIFPKDEEIRRFIEERDAEAKHNADTNARWQAATPASLRDPKLWEKMDGIGSDVNPLRAPLAKAIPDVHARILALLTWYGSGDGPWSGFPAYEEVAEQLLLDYPTEEILAAIASAKMTDAQIEGAARLFGGWKFSQKRPDDRKTLPPALKKMLLEHSLKSEDQDKRGRAERAFQ